MDSETIKAKEDSRRLANKTARKDILTNVVDKVEKGEVPQEEMTAHASTLVYVEATVGI